MNRTAAINRVALRNADLASRGLQRRCLATRIPDWLAIEVTVTAWTGRRNATTTARTTIRRLSTALAD
jgi:hypothetical protein